MKHFNNPVSMRVTQEQFERDLKKPLEELGAKFEGIVDFKKYPILVSNSSGVKGIIENVFESDKLNFNRHFIETYDPEQFIAICELEVEMIVGECYTVSADCLDSKLTGYILENNVGNNKDGLWGYFKGVGYLGYYFEKSHINYFSETYTIRLSTPEEKAKLDKVFAEHEKSVNEISLNPDGGYQEIEVKDEIIISKEYKKSCDLWIKTQELSIKQTELQLKNCKNNIKLEKESKRLSKKRLKHEKKILKEFLNNLENEI